MITHKEAIEWFEYRDGRLYWKKDKGNRAKAGDLADRVTCFGYKVTNLNRTRYFTHRVIWLLLKGYWPKDQINHIDLNKLNNSIENLEECSNAENLQRTGTRKTNTSGCRGVGWHKKANKWVVSICVESEEKYLGLFSKFEDAVSARKEAELKYYGRACP